MISTGFTSKGNVANKLPGVTKITASIDLDQGLAQVGGNAAAGAQNSASREVTDSLRKLIQEGLITETPVVLGVLDPRNLLSGLATIDTLDDGEPDQRWLGGVVLPSG